MAKFVIYNYNFSKIIEPNEQLRIEFPEWGNVNVEESFKNKQLLLDEILQKDYEQTIQFVNAKGKEKWHKQIIKPVDNVYVMRIANITSVKITDENLKLKEYNDYRNCLVIIDNRAGIQRIAIEKKTKAFSTTTTVANIIQATFCKLLKYKLLKVTLSAVYGTNVFWTTVNDYPEGFVKVRFHFPHLNLERLTNAMDKYLKTAREDWDSDLDFSFGANEGGTVKIAPNNERQRALVEGASGAGIWIELHPKSKNKRIIYCGKNQYIEREIDDKLFEAITNNIQTVIPGIGESAMDKLKIVLKNIPNSFN